jgi:hypothetical protein
MRTFKSRYACTACFFVLVVLLGADLAQGMYNPKHGRWLQRDPIGYVDGMNLYVYVRCLPTGDQDPTGLIPVDTALDLGFLLFDLG